MKRRSQWRALVLAALLSACSGLPSAPTRPAVYDFGPGALDAPARSNPGGPPIVLEGVSAPPALEGTAMLYRLAYADMQRLRPYAGARWSMPPSQLVRGRLRDALNLERAVLDSGQSGVPLALHVELQEFSQVFDSPRKSAGLVRLRATLFDLHGGADHLIAQRIFVVRRPAETPDASGGVRALTAATDAAVEAIGAWLQRQAVR